MGFSKQKAITEVKIPLELNIAGADGEVEKTNVLHVYKLPSTKARAAYERELVQQRGRRTRFSRSNANFTLFRETILYVEGYDDLPYTKEQQMNDRLIRDEIIRYFSDDIGRIQVDEGIDRLLDIIGAGDPELEKKLEQSSEESYTIQQKEIPMKVMK